jgi:hypothetical protein
VYPSHAPGFVPACTDSLCVAPVSVATAHAQGPRARALAPPEYAPDAPWTPEIPGEGRAGLM